jgi:hypothetical protein
MMGRGPGGDLPTDGPRNAGASAKIAHNPTIFAFSLHAQRGAMSKAKRQGSHRADKGVDAAQVYERLFGAIMDHSLPPQTRLVEERLCEIFGTRSRALGPETRGCGTRKVDLQSALTR